LPPYGRKHQIRRHLKHIAHPIIGDSTYGRGRHNRYFAEHLGCQRLLLACSALRLQHPVTQEALTLRAPLSGEFATLLERFGWPDQ
jgi:tRNA pseudouridine65 synthase